MSENIDEMRAFADMARGGCCEGGRCNSTEKRADVPAKPAPVVTSTVGKKTVLEEAAEITSVDRQLDYGHPLLNHQRIRRLWNAYDENKPVPFSPDSERDIVFKMILTKIARDQHRNKRDNIVDIPGYCRVIERIDEALAELEAQTES